MAKPWTSEIVAQRAADHLTARAALRDARQAYKLACLHYRQSHGLPFEALDVDSPVFRRATRMTYLMFDKARTDEYSARRRLGAAVRGYMDVMR